MANDMPAVTLLKQRQKMMWSLGDYREVARMLERDAVALADACGLAPGMRVLDVAAGNGNLAIAAARRGAQVIASDFNQQMIGWGRDRCAAEGLHVEWREADAEDLPFADGMFDCCVSMFGAMFAPRPALVAQELFRVTRSGGTVAMANWTRDGFLGRLAALITIYAPPAPPEILQLPSPFDWADQDVVRRLFEGRAGSIELARRTACFSFSSLQAGLAFFETNNAPMVAIRAILPPERYDILAGEATALMEECNHATDGCVVLDLDYLSIIARKAG